MQRHHPGPRASVMKAISTLKFAEPLVVSENLFQRFFSGVNVKTKKKKKKKYFNRDLHSREQHLPQRTTRFTA